MVRFVEGSLAIQECNNFIPNAIVAALSDLGVDLVGLVEGSLAVKEFNNVIPNAKVAALSAYKDVSGPYYGRQT